MNSANRVSAYTDTNAHADTNTHGSREREREKRKKEKEMFVRIDRKQNKGKINVDRIEFGCSLEA